MKSRLLSEFLSEHGYTLSGCNVNMHLQEMVDGKFEKCLFCTVRAYDRINAFPQEFIVYPRRVDISFQYFPMCDDFLLIQDKYDEMCSVWRWYGQTCGDDIILLGGDNLQLNNIKGITDYIVSEPVFVTHKSLTE